MGFLEGLIFGPGIFLSFVGSPRNFFGFCVLALLEHPCHLKSGVHPPPPGTLVFLGVFTTECQYFCLGSLGVVIKQEEEKKEGKEQMTTSFSQLKSL